MVTQVTEVNCISGSSFSCVVPAHVGAGCGHVTFFGQWDIRKQCSYGLHGHLDTVFVFWECWVWWGRTSRAKMQMNQQRPRHAFEGLEVRNGDPICNSIVWVDMGHTGYLKPDFHFLVTLLWGFSPGFNTNNLALLLGNAGCPQQLGVKVCREISTGFSFKVVCGVCYLQPILLLSGATEPIQVLSE